MASLPNPSDELDLPIAEAIVVVEATVLPPTILPPTIDKASLFGPRPTPPRPRVSREDRFAARGGATAALVIGAWGCLTCWIPSSNAAVGWVVLVALLGIVMGLWGLASVFVRRALWGIGLCSLNIGLVMLLNVMRLQN